MNRDCDMDMDEITQEEKKRGFGTSLGQLEDHKLPKETQSRGKGKPRERKLQKPEGRSSSSVDMRLGKMII